MLLSSSSDDLEITTLSTFVAIKHGDFLGQLKELLKKELYFTEWLTKGNSLFMLKDCVLNLTCAVPNEAIHLDFVFMAYQI